MTPSRFALLTALVASLAAPASSAVTKEEIQKTFQENPDLVLDVLRQNHKQLMDILNQAVQEERQRQAQEQAAAEEKEIADALKNPLKAAMDSKTHVRGSKKAKYTLVEYSDFQCPYCGRGFTTVEELRKKYGNDMRFIFKDKPLPMHPQAMPAAKWFEAVALQSQDKAWLFHDKMFQNQDKLSEDFFKQTAKELGVDVEKAEKDAQSKEVADKISADVAEAEKYGFSGTPGFLINGVPLRGAYPVESFDSIIKRLDSKEAKN